MSVALDIQDHIATVQLNRPDKANALNGEMFEGLVGAAREIAGRSDVRAAVLSGAGENFCAGIDMGFLQSAVTPAKFRTMALDLPEDEIANYFQAPSVVWRTLDVPVIAAVQGAAYGGGCQIALGADMRIVGPTARFALREMHWGIIPDMGVTVTLPPLVRFDVAMDLVLTARAVGAEEAQRIGLVTRAADDPVAAAQSLAQEIAGRNPDAVRAAKRMLRDGWRKEAADSLRLEAELQANVVSGQNFIETMSAAFQKRAPNFT